MEQTAELQSIGEILGATRFWAANTKAEEAAKFKGRSDVFVGADGIVRCKKCKQPRMFYFAETGRWLPCACACNGAEDEDKAELIAANRRQSGIDGRYSRADFEKFDETPENKEVFEACLRFALRFEKVRKRGMGIYLHGQSGTGKTYLAACIGNMLLESGVEVFFANVNTILSEIRYAYSQRNSELPIVQKYMNAEFMIFDDIGTEKYSTRTEAMSFAQDKFFQIIDGRYIRQKPTVFTSNYTLEQLVAERGMLVKTVDRIAEMSTRKFELKGKPRRLERITDEDCPF